MPVECCVAASEEVGFIGVGTIGAPMARRLQGAGRPLVVHDLRPEELRPLVDAGARAASRPRELAVPMPVVSAAHQTYLQALAQGLGSRVFFATLLAVEAAARHEVPKLEG
jgi:3-hydroxyisobutyrate dehydrogenase-like beta-hydroxyacid dehydrogenase